MAILHQRATLTPTKLELAAAWLDRQGLRGAGDVQLAGSYRFDDPEGKVGIEALLVRRAGEVLHLPLTYRGAPLDGAGAHLITTLEHSVLGRRWVYDAAADPVGPGPAGRAGPTGASRSPGAPSLPVNFSHRVNFFLDVKKKRSRRLFFTGCDLFTGKCRGAARRPGRGPPTGQRTLPAGNAMHAVASRTTIGLPAADALTAGHPFTGRSRR